MEFAAPLGAHLAIPGRVSGTPAKSSPQGDARCLRVVFGTSAKGMKV